MASPITWIAGPTHYWEGNYMSFDLAWDFIGGNANHDIRRWRLRYKADERRFSISALNADRGDQAHATQLRELYRHAMVRRSDLPKGAIVKALQAMLPEKEIAAALALSITKGKK